MCEFILKNFPNIQNLRVYACMCMYMNMYMRMYVCIYIYIYICIYMTERDKEDARRARDLLLEEQRMSGSVEEEGPGERPEM
jgi:hypothetical protein